MMIMNLEEQIGRVYDFIEEYDFVDLSESQKSVVLGVMSEMEYVQMRAAVVNTRNYLVDEVAPDLKTASFVRNERLDRFIYLMITPIPLYRVAVLIVVIFSSFLAFKLMVNDIRAPEIASVKTSQVLNIDTVYITLVDTLEILKEKIVYIEKNQPIVDEKSINVPAIFELDCKTEICPNDIEQLKNLAYNNKISNDTLLKKFLQTLN